MANITYAVGVLTPQVKVFPSPKKADRVHRFGGETTHCQSRDKRAGLRSGSVGGRLYNGRQEKPGNRRLCPGSSAGLSQC